MKGLRDMWHSLWGSRREAVYAGHYRHHATTCVPFETAETLHRKLDVLEARLEQRRLRVLDAEAGTVPRESE